MPQGKKPDQCTASCCKICQRVIKASIFTKLDMNEQLLQGGNVFEITDYTTASDWERFIAGIEELLTEWGLNKESNKESTYRELPEGYISKGFWREKHDVIKFGNVTFDLRYQYLEDSELKREGILDSEVLVEDPTNSRSVANSSSSSDCDEFEEANDEYQFHQIPEEKEKEHGEHELPDNAAECVRDLISTTNDFASKAHCLVRWYNLRRYILLMPRGDTIVSEDRVKLVLSSASVALSNIDCHVPFFVQTHNPKNNFFQGISEHSNTRTTYEMIYYKRNLQQYAYLSELISLFREKTSCSLSDPVSITVRLNYCLDSFDLFVSPNDEFTGAEHSDEDDVPVKAISDKAKKSEKRQVMSQDMRTTATYEQVVEALEDCLPHPYRILKFLHVAALWPPVSDKVIADSRVHSDLDPAEAPIWTIRCVTSDNCNMKIVHETQAVYELFMAAINHAYNKLDGSKIFAGTDRKTIEDTCLKLCYELATNSEVVLSKSPSDHTRKLVALLFYRASELRQVDSPAESIAGHLKKPKSLAEIYRDFRTNEPSVKEFIIRTQISRPFNPIITPALPQRMFCTLCKEEFRLCGAFSELCN